MAVEGQPGAQGAHAGSEPRRGSDGSLVAGVAVLVLLGACWIWWALAEGAYVGTLPYPETTLHLGVLLLSCGFGLMLRRAPWDADLALSKPLRVALWGLVALGVWTGASATWSAAPDIAIADGQRVLAYVMACGFGLWSCILLARHMELALLPLTASVGVVGIVAFVALAVGDDPARYLEVDGTLIFPLGYRNANAAFALAGLLPAIAIAASTRMGRLLRAGALVAATIAIEVAILCQSRGSVLAVLAAILVYLALAPDRGRAAICLALAAIPALICLPAALDTYDAARAGENFAGVADDMNRSGVAALLGAAASALIALAVVRLDHRGRHIPQPRLPASTAARALLAVAVLTAVAGTLLATNANPVAWTGDRVDEFLAGEPDLSAEASRFTLNAGSNRSDLWRVALGAFPEDPVFGDGAGAFQYRYTRERRDPLQFVQDAHSIEIETLSELGIVGLGLLAAALGGLGLAAARARRLGPAAASLSAGALGAGAYWLVHASMDWFWAYPAVTAPVLALLGAAAAPGILAPRRGSGQRRARLALAGVGALLAISMVPSLLGARFIANAYSGYQEDLPRAYADLDRASWLQPLSEAPAAAEGVIARRVGDTERAAAALDDVIERRPEEWAGHYFRALLYLPDEPLAAARELDVVDGLNPLGAPRVERLRDRVEAALARPAGRR